MSHRSSLAFLVSFMLAASGTVGCGDDDGGQNDNANQNNASAECGNGVIEGDEVCDGEALDGEDCVGQSFDGGELACASDCSGFVTDGCCTDGCADDGATQCDGDTLQTCETAATGCLDWTLLDCTAGDQICHDDGTDAICADDCTSDCTTEGDRECDGDTVMVCAVNGICLNWTVDTTCDAQVGCDAGACRDDGDGDGYSEHFGDCDDTDDTVYPDATEIPGDGIDQNCDGPDGRVGIDQYVPGTYAVAALEYAVDTCLDATDNCYVYVERGTFEITSPFTIQSNNASPHEIGIIGGYDTDGEFLTRHFGDSTAGWQGSYGSDAAYATVIAYAAPTTEQSTVSLSGNHPDNRIWLNGIRIEGPEQTTAGGASVAVSIHGADTAVHLERCLVVGGVAGDGVAGSAGGNGGGGGAGGSGSGGTWGDLPVWGGAGGSSSCSSGHSGVWSHYASCEVSFDEADSSHGANGASNYDVQPDCNSTVLPRHRGGPGGNGADGADGGCGSGGTAVTSFGSLATGQWTPPGAAGAGTAGTNGSGGYGGGSGGAYVGGCSAVETLLGAGGGGGGGGGCAGSGGTAGGHGGSCFGILVTDATPAHVVLAQVTVERGTAGTGGAGGSGGNGGNGGAGSNGKWGTSWGGGKVCSSGSGGNGGNGGAGGGSGGGAGGNGGNSVGLAATAAVDDSGVTYTGGTAGTAGSGGAMGASGSGGPTCSAAGDDGSAGQLLDNKLDY